MTDDATSADADARMAEAGARLVAAVRDGGAAWVVGVVTERLDQWGGLAAPDRTAAIAAAEQDGTVAARRVADELVALLALPAAEQRLTPLEVMRGLRVEATGVLAAAGVPEVVRDEFEERAFPDDVYGIVLRAPAELGDDELGAVLLAWGLAKTRVLRGPDSVE